LNRPAGVKVGSLLSARTHTKWIPPPSDMAKINVDAAVPKTGGRGVAMAICRDADGVYLGVLHVTLKGITNPRSDPSRTTSPPLASRHQKGK
jgi:hypothetical protein